MNDIIHFSLSVVIHLPTDTISRQHTMSQPLAPLPTQWIYSVLGIYVAPRFLCTYMPFFGNIWVIMNCAAAGEAALVLNDIFSQVFFLLRIKCFLIIPIKKLLSAYVILPPLKKIASNVNSSHIHTCFAVKEFGGKL